MSLAENKVLAVFDARAQNASAMTHALSELGNGDMANGITTLWQSGWNSGFFQGATITAVLFVVGIGAPKVVAYIRKDHRIKKLLREADCEPHINKPAYEGECLYA